MQAPQTPCSQPKWVPVRYVSRRKSAMRARLDLGLTASPLTLILTVSLRAACSIARRSATTCVCLSSGSVIPAFIEKFVGDAAVEHVEQPGARPSPIILSAFAMTIGRVSVAPMTARQTPRSGSDDEGADRMREFASLAADLVIAPARRTT